MKLILSSVIMLISAICAYDIVRIDRRRVRSLESSLEMIRLMNVYIQSEQLELNMIIGKLCENSRFMSLDYLFLCRDEINSNRDFDDSWRYAIENSSVEFKQNEKELLMSLADKLGRTDAQYQNGMLNDFFADFEVCIEKAKDYANTNSRPVCALILSAGMILSIMLI